MENVQPNVKPLGPHEAIGTMTREQLRAELFGILEQFDIAIPRASVLRGTSTSAT